MKIDHIGYAVSNIDKAKEAFIVLGYDFESNVIDEDRNIVIAFGVKDGLRIELVSPLSKNIKSPVDGYLKKVMVTLTGIFRDIFDDDKLIITESTTADNIDGWDSLTHISLLTAVENTFDFQFPIDRISNMKNVGEMVAIILEMGK